MIGRRGFITGLVAVVVVGAAHAEGPLFAQGCTWQEANGGVVFAAGCDPEFMRSLGPSLIADARKRRTPNAADFEELNHRLDRIIELLEKQAVGR